MIRSGRGFHSLSQLLVGEFVFALRAQTGRQNRADAVHLRVPLEHVLQNSGGRINLTSIIQHARVKRLDQRMIRFQLRALIDLVAALLRNVPGT